MTSETQTHNALVSVNFDGLSEPGKLLIEKVAGGLGGFFAPWQLKRMAKAEAEVDIIKAQAQIQVTDLHRRAACRWFEEEAQRQKNIEDITMQAIPHLQENADASKIDDDWMTNFFDKSRIISNPELQQLWARLLAGETNKPGSCSKRTVNILGDMDKNDAEIFTKLCGFCCIFNFHDITPLIFNLDDDIYLHNGINFYAINHLESLSLVSVSGITGFLIRGLQKKIVIYYYGTPLYLTMKEDGNNALKIGKVLLTQSGQDLAPICGSQPVPGFKEYIKSKWQAFSPSEVASSSL